jgi:predicted secreted hydrolase
MNSTRRRLLIFLCLLPIIAPALAADSASQFTVAREGYRYEFPRDHGSHDNFRTEWWYYTGHLASKDGRRFGYQLTLFRRGMPPDQINTLPSKWSVTQLYLAHFAVSDLSKQQFHYREKLSRAGLGKAGAETGRLNVWIDDWHADAHQDRQVLNATDGDLAIHLELLPEKALVLHGSGGVSRKGNESGQASHYYSFTRMSTTGTVTIGKDAFDVIGTSWMDHEFGSTDLGKELVGWDWFSIQLANQTELMLYRLRRTDGSTDPVSSGTFVDREGRAQHLSIEDFTLEPLSEWTSPTSKARYPQKWRLNVPSKKLSLELAPLLAEQELSTTRSTQVTYWEGAIEVTGVAEGGKIKGQGYMELTGYAERFSKKL